MVVTKFLPRTNEEIEAGITGQQHIERMLNKSLENLGMDYVDLYIYHMWDHRTPIYDILDGLKPDGQSRESPLHRHLKLFCLSAGKSQRFGRKRRICKICVRSESL